DRTRSGHRALQVRTLMSVSVAAATLRRAQHDSELIVDSVLQHDPHLPDERAPSQHSVTVDRPEDESLEPDNESEQPTLFARVQVGEHDQYRHQHAGNREEELEILCEPRQEDIPPGGTAIHSDLVSLKTPSRAAARSYRRREPF